MTEFDSMNKASKASWVTRYNCTDSNAPWKIIPNNMTQHLGVFQFLLSCRYTEMKELTPNNTPSFYIKILKSWEMIKNIKCAREFDQDKTNSHDAIIWNNSDIKIAGQPIF